jgi:hypothetical protein
MVVSLPPRITSVVALGMVEEVGAAATAAPANAAAMPMPLINASSGLRKLLMPIMPASPFLAFAPPHRYIARLNRARSRHAHGSSARRA